MHETASARPLMGFGAPCFIAAEVGVNQQRRPGYGRTHDRGGRRCGSRRGQIPELPHRGLRHDKGLLLEYRSIGQNVSEPQYDLFKAL